MIGWHCGYCERGGKTKTRASARTSLTKHANRCEARRESRMRMAAYRCEEEDLNRLRIQGREPPEAGK